MFSKKDLKENIKITEGNEVECPVKDCTKKVKRQEKIFKRDKIFECPEHKIYISPSTFEYENENGNILWNEKDDSELFKKIKTVKRESRFARENSEDAVTWNVFRYLERKSLLAEFLCTITGENTVFEDIVYWSYSQFGMGGAFGSLNQARQLFGETLTKGSEPDIIILTDKTLFFIETKLLASNKTLPTNPYVKERYVSGDNRWFTRVFVSDYDTIAVKEQKFELMRFWLLGTWMAKRINRKFRLCNLVLKRRESDIEDIFRKHIKSDNNNTFSRIEWESIYSFVKSKNMTDEDTIKLLNYYENKTVGYNKEGRLVSAFSV